MYKLNSSVNSNRDTGVFDLLAEDFVNSGCFVAFHFLIAPHRSFMLKGLVKSEGPRGEHVSAAFGRLTLLEWWSGFPRLFTRSW